MGMLRPGEQGVADEAPVYSLVCVCVGVCVYCAAALQGRCASVITLRFCGCPLEMICGRTVSSAQHDGAWSHVSVPLPAGGVPETRARMPVMRAQMHNVRYAFDHSTTNALVSLSPLRECDPACILATTCTHSCSTALCSHNYCVPGILGSLHLWRRQVIRRLRHA